MDKVVFTDIDGVLNNADCIYDGVCLDPTLVKRLRVIPDDWRIVISSSWRIIHDLHEIKLGLRWAGYEEAMMKVVGVTPSMGGQPRGAEIQKFRKLNGVHRYVIIDDDDDMLDLQQPHFVKTTWKEGLTEEKAQELKEKIEAWNR